MENKKAAWPKFGEWVYNESGSLTAQNAGRKSKTSRRSVRIAEPAWAILTNLAETIPGLG